MRGWVGEFSGGWVVGLVRGWVGGLLVGSAVCCRLAAVCCLLSAGGCLLSAGGWRLAVMLLPSLLSVVHRPYHNPHSTLRHLNTAHAHLDREAASHERFNHLLLLRERHDAVVGHQHAAPRPHDLCEERRTRQQGHGDGVTVVGLRWWGYGGGVTVAGLRWRGYGGGAGGEDGGAGGEDGGAQEAKMVVQEVTVSLTMALFLHFASTFTSSASRKFLSTRMVCRVGCRVQGAGCRVQGVGRRV
jgi:hypothetical protein